MKSSETPRLTLRVGQKTSCREWLRQAARVPEATYLLEVGQLPAGNYFLRLQDAVGRTLGTEAFVKVR